MTGPLVAGKPVTIAVPCAGIAPGGVVTVKIFEPMALGGDPLDTIQAKVDEGGGVALASWTYDYPKYKDKVSASVFVFVVEGAGRTSMSGPVAFVETFKATIKDAAGHPAADRIVILHAQRGADVTTRTNEAGQVKVDVPPGIYVIEVRGPVPPGSPPGPPVEKEPGADDDTPPLLLPVDGEPADGTSGQAPAGEGWTVRLEWSDAARAVASVGLASSSYSQTSERAGARLESDQLIFPFPEGPPGTYTVTLNSVDGHTILALEGLVLPDGAATDDAARPEDAAANAGDGGQQDDPTYFCGDPSAQPHQSCFELDGAHFDFDSSFVRKDGLESLVQVHETLGQDAQRLAMVYGHTDTVGSEDYNKVLSERRASVIFAALVQDADIWESVYQKESWGTRKVQAMLNAVRSGDEPEIAVDGEAGPETSGAVKRFQARTDHAPLPSSGTADKATRHELFLAYMKLSGADPIDRSRFKDFAGTSFMGCGIYNPFAEGKDQASRRVTVLIFDPAADPGALPCKIGDIGPCQANLLGPNDPPRGQPGDKVPLFRCKVFRALSAKCPCCTGGGNDAGIFQYALDTGDARWPQDVLVRIQSEDGAHVQTFGLQDGTASDNLRIFKFTETRPGVRYKGHVQTSDGVIFGLFGLVELAKIIDPNDTTNVLPLPSVDPGQEAPPDPLPDVPAVPDPPGSVDANAVANAASSPLGPLPIPSA